MSSLSSGHGESDLHQHHLAFALMLLAVAVAMVTLIIETHTVIRNTDPMPGPSVVTHCQKIDAIRYCVDE